MDSQKCLLPLSHVGCNFFSTHQREGATHYNIRNSSNRFLMSRQLGNCPSVSHSPKLGKLFTLCEKKTVLKQLQKPLIPWSLHTTIEGRTRNRWCAYKRLTKRNTEGFVIIEAWKRRARLPINPAAAPAAGEIHPYVAKPWPSSITPAHSQSGEFTSVSDTSKTS